MRTVLITGAGSGIGRHLSEAYAEQGFSVMATDLNAASAADTAKIITESGGTALSMPVNVTDEKQVADAFAAMHAKWGSVDCVISNAGIQIISPIEELTLKDWQLMLDIHLTGAMLCTREAVKYMYPQKHGCVLYIGSIHSKVASFGKAPYNTAKHGLLGLCRTLAKEGAPHNLRTNVICPGFVRTPLVDKQIPEQAKALNISEEDVVKKIMLGQTVDSEFTTPDEISATALFLTNYPNLGLTGQSLMLTHGWEMQ